MDAATTIQLAPLVDTAASLLAALLLGLGAWLIQRVAAWLKLAEDDKVRLYLEEALHNAIAFARNKAIQQGQRIDEIEVRSQVVANAANYAIARVPDALKRFGIDEDGVRDLVLARLPGPPPRPAQQ